MRWLILARISNQPENIGSLSNDVGGEFPAQRIFLWVFIVLSIN